MNNRLPINLEIILISSNGGSNDYLKENHLIDHPKKKKKSATDIE